MSADAVVAATRLGIAVGAEGVWAVPLGALGRAAVRGRVWHRTLDGMEERDLAQAFRSLRDELQADGAPVHVALLPSVVQSRRLDVPPLPRETVRHVLRRYARKYFFLPDDDVVIDASVLERRGRRAPQAVLGSAVSREFLETLHAAIASVGWSVDSVVPAYEAWAAALAKMTGGERDFWFVLCGAERIELLRLQGGRVTSIRQLRNDDRAVARLPELMRTEAADRSDAAVEEVSIPVAVLGVGPTRDGVDDLMADLGVEPVQLDPEQLKGGIAGAAAAYAAEARDADLLPDTLRSERRRVVFRTTFGFAAVALVLLVVAAGLGLVGARRELAVLGARRAAIRAAVSDAVTERDTLLTLAQRLTTLSALEGTAPHWSAVIATVTDLLPDDAHLVALRASGDTLVLEGIAERAASVFEAFQAAPGMTDVRAEAPVRRETTGADGPVERFTLAATLTSGGSGGRP